MRSDRFVSLIVFLLDIGMFPDIKHPLSTCDNMESVGPGECEPGGLRGSILRGWDLLSFAFTCRSSNTTCIIDQYLYLMLVLVVLLDQYILNIYYIFFRYLSFLSSDRIFCTCISCT